MEETFKFLFALRVQMRKKLTQAQCPSFLPSHRALLWETRFYTAQVYTTQVWLIRANPPNHRLAHERECDPNLPLTTTFLFYVYGSEEGEESREKEGMRLQPQYLSHRLWSGPNWRQWFLAPRVWVNLRHW